MRRLDSSLPEALDDVKKEGRIVGDGRPEDDKEEDDNRKNDGLSPPLADVENLSILEWLEMEMVFMSALLLANLALAVAASATASKSSRVTLGPLGLVLALGLGLGLDLDLDLGLVLVLVVDLDLALNWALNWALALALEWAVSSTTPLFWARLATCFALERVEMVMVGQVVVVARC
eukprot:CAMPEP_0185803264 /NCGR_PEP_ID=MMETSP1322-20130828/2522_1 /TAXON_ID=265543 /ORGANISM="Minutocellus polymorphus, Strain RCC2270" /LENGTH=176 /DNA_ID=CAMNT_0028499127 /DNA_START=165 /DNA_END=696 /DNA_ORIENTATION=-